MTWPSAQAVLVAEVDALHDYSLLEPPVTRAGASAQSNENVLPTARQIAAATRAYSLLTTCSAAARTIAASAGATTICVPFASVKSLGIVVAACEVILLVITSAAV